MSWHFNSWWPIPGDCHRNSSLGKHLLWGNDWIHGFQTTRGQSSWRLWLSCQMLLDALHTHPPTFCLYNHQRIPYTLIPGSLPCWSSHAGNRCPPWLVQVPGGSGKESACQCRRLELNVWVGKIPWRRERQPTPVFLPEERHGQRSLVGYSPWGHKESGMTE